MRKNYYIDSYLHYYLTQTTSYLYIKHLEYRVFKYLFNKGKKYSIDRKFSIKILKYLFNIDPVDTDYYLYTATLLSLNLKIIKYLIKKGANVNYYECSPTENTVNNNDLITVKYLLKNDGIFNISYSDLIYNNQVYNYYLSKIGN